MTHSTLPVWRKLCYAVGGVPQQLTNCVIGFFLQVYLLYIAKLTPGEVAVVLFSGRAWDAVTDPAVGWLVTRSPQTRFGRLKLWIVAATVPTAATYVALWLVPVVAMRWVYYTVIYCLFQTSQTCFYIPYSALTMSLSVHQKDRDSATAYRMTAEVLGMLLGSVIQSAAVPTAVVCLDVNASSVKADDDHDASVGYAIAAGTAAVLYVVCAAVLTLGVRADVAFEAPTSAPTLACVRRVATYRPYVTLTAAFLFTSMAFMLIQGNFALFCSQTLGLKESCQTIILTIIVSAAVAVPCWQKFIARFGKRKAAFVGLSSGVPFMTAVVCVPPLPAVIYTLAVGSGAAIGAAFLIPWSMLPDVIERFAAQTGDASGEVFFYSLYILFTKLAVGLAMAASTVLLSAAGYITGACRQPDTVHLVLRVLMSAVPIALIGVGLGILYRYPDDAASSRDGNDPAP